MTPSKKVLIIEDDVDMVEAVKTVLESKGHEVIAAYRPDEGYHLALTEKPNLIILDVMFGKPGNSEGFALARKFRQDKALAHIPILMETAVNTENPGFDFSEKDSEFLPVDDFLNKPAQPDEIIAKAQKLLDAGVSEWA